MSFTDFGGLAPINVQRVGDHVTGVQFGNDANMFVFFFTKAVTNESKSRDANTLVVENVDFVHIQHPGERDFQERPAREEDKMRWPKAWEAYRAGKEAIPDGTPIEVLFPGNPAIVATLKHLKLHTIQQLAGMSAEAEGRVGMGAGEWKQKAIKYLAAAKDTESFNKMEAALSKRDDEIAVLKSQVAALTAAMNEKQAKKSDDDFEAPIDEPKRGPGRPRKSPFET